MKRNSDSASSHRYITGDYSTVTESQVETYNNLNNYSSEKSFNHKKRTFESKYLIAFIITVVIIFSIIIWSSHSMYNSAIVASKPVKATNKIAAAVQKKPPIKAIADKLKNMEILGKSISFILGSNYTMDSVEGVKTGGNDSSFNLDYNKKDVIQQVTTNSLYDPVNQSYMYNSLSIQLKELKVNQGIKIDERVKSILAGFSTVPDYKKVFAEGESLCKTLTEDKSGESKLNYGDTYVMITASIQDEHINLMYYVNTTSKFK